MTASEKQRRILPQEWLTQPSNSEFVLSLLRSKTLPVVLVLATWSHFVSRVREHSGCKFATGNKGAIRPIQSTQTGGSTRQCELSTEGWWKESGSVKRLT